MPTQRYALEKGGEKKLEVSWNWHWKNLAVKFDGEDLGQVSTQKELREGRDFNLPDGKILHLRLVSGLFENNLHLLVDGEPVPGSACDPESKIGSAAGTVFFIAALNIVLGLVDSLFQVEFIQRLGIGVYSFGFGAAYLGLGFLVRAKQWWALLAAIVIFVGDGLLGYFLILQAGLNPNAGALLGRALLVVFMIQGLVAMLKKKG